MKDSFYSDFVFQYMIYMLRHFLVWQGGSWSIRKLDIKSYFYMFDKGIKVHIPLSDRCNILCNCSLFTFPSVNNSRQLLRCHFSQVLLVVSLGL